MIIGWRVLEFIISVISSYNVIKDKGNCLQESKDIFKSSKASSEFDFCRNGLHYEHIQN